MWLLVMLLSSTPAAAGTPTRDTLLPLDLGLFLRPLPLPLPAMAICATQLNQVRYAPHNSIKCGGAYKWNSKEKYLFISTSSLMFCNRTVLCNIRRPILTQYTPRKGSLHLFFASLLFSASAVPSTFTYHSTITFINMQRQNNVRRSSKRLKSSTTVGLRQSSTEQYDSMKVSELKDILKERGLAVSGIKSVLIERLKSSSTDAPTNKTAKASSTQPKAKRARKQKSEGVSIPQASSVDCLPRTREMQLLKPNLFIIGVDEAGRGPLAGPVVAAAAIVPTDIAGIIDSKKITKEEERERLYEELIVSSGIRYAVAVVSAQRIDEINILQATLEGMRMATEGVMNMDSNKKKKKVNNVASAERKEISYVITGSVEDNSKSKGSSSKSSYYTLIDGNKVPKDMPCEAESMVKGDGREYSIGAASILAKVTRDRLMHEYHVKYPEYNLAQHKGYPTASHMAACRKHGASPIHRRTFAPLKHWDFDDDGNIIG